MRQKLCTTHSNNYDDLEKIIIESLSDNFFKYIDKDKIKNSVLNSLNENNQNNSKKELELLNKRIEQINDNLDTIYIDKLNKKITLEQFERVKIKLEDELDTVKTKYSELNDIVDNNKSKDKIIVKYINDFLSMKEFNRELMVCLIDRIDIYEDKRIDIKVIFNIDAKTNI